MLPCLTIVADVAGLLGGFATGTMVYQISAASYIDTTLRWLMFRDVLSGLIKSLVFAIIITMKIYLGNIAYVRACDVVVANCNAFRGALVDDGTAYELGLGNGLGKPTYGYIDAVLPTVQNVLHRYPCTIPADGVPIDQDGYLVVDDFGTAINLMLECGMLLGGGRLVEGSFEDCLRTMLAGLAGAVEILGLYHTLPATFSTGYGFDAIAIALLAKSHPLGVLPAAVLWGGLRNGAGLMQVRTGVSIDLINVIQALVIMGLAADHLVRTLRRRRVGVA